MINKKLAEYKGNWKGRQLYAHNIEDYTDITFEEWCEFTGLFCKTFPNGFLPKSEISLSGYYPTFDIWADNENIELELKVDILDKKIFNKCFFLKKDTGEGRGTAAMNTQIQLATLAGFLNLECRAEGEGRSSLSWDKLFHGFITWGKMGFSMKPAFQALFNEFVTPITHSPNLNDLLSKDEGRTYWEKEGWPWEGTFSLTPASPNRKLFEDYMNKNKKN